MAFFVYVLSALTSLTCAILLARAYRKTKLRLLLWSCLCFVCLAINNTLLFVDLVILPVEVSLVTYRAISALFAMSLMVYGLVWDAT